MLTDKNIIYIQSVKTGVFSVKGIQLRAYDDSWETLSRMPELMDLMARIQIEELKPTVSEFAEMLKGIGFKDITAR